MRRHAPDWVRHAVWLLLAVVVAGCKIEEPPRIPVTREQYDSLSTSEAMQYPKTSVTKYNLVQVADEDVDLVGRKASLDLIDYLGVATPDQLADLSGALQQQGAPQELQAMVASLKTRRGGSPTAPVGIAATPPRAVGATPPVIRPRPATPPVTASVPDDALLARLQQARANDLADVVKEWARRRETKGRYENAYRSCVTRLTGKRWDQGLVWAINAPSFYARGSALHVLNTRISEQELGRLLDTVVPQTDAMRALRMFQRRVGYIPRDSSSFLGIVLLYTTSREMIPEAGKLSDQWNTEHGYVFNLRDFHLLSRLASDPLRKAMRRGDLSLTLGRTLLRRSHVPTQARSGKTGNDRFNEQVEKLTMPDLANLYLLNTMLSDARMQKALALMAARDREDTQRAWGGLVFYNNGRIEPKLYEASLEAGASDDMYVPSAICRRHGRDALCRFHGHFRRVANAREAGPSDLEIAEAKKDNIYGLVLTGLDDGAFCAHYYTPTGTVVSLGTFPFPGPGR